MSTADRPVVVTPGEPAGIGPDIAIAAYLDDAGARNLFVADPLLMDNRARQLGHTLTLNDWHTNGWQDGAMNLLPVACTAPVRPGTANPDNAGYVLATLRAALDCCLDGRGSAMVTGPVNKAVINQSGVPFSGHTEWLAENCGVERVVMMLASPRLKVALATTHLPLRDVADAITITSLQQTLRILITDLQTKFAISKPRILICGLNPHAGEDGHLGREEIDVIRPALANFTGTDCELTGPLPADTAFTPVHLEQADAVLAMYHDQGLPVLKHEGFGEAINITLGLPVIRTSVDHGTAFDLAGSGAADPGSMKTAIDLAHQLARSTAQ